eukprot:scaffold5766_cov110-Isochrysis_galbana.AAC.8
MVAVLLARLAEQVVVGLWQLDAREEIRAEHQHILILIREGPLQVSGRAKDGHHRAHAIVVVVLRRELLRAQLVGLHDLARQRPRLEVARREQHHLANHRVVGHHHRDGAEEHLEVVGQLGPAGVARVHRDKGVAHHLERERRTFEQELLGVGRLGALDGQDLLRDHREHLEVDPVELVEADPGASRGNALEKLGHRDVVETVGAVHHDALYGHRLAQVLGRLRLAGARWALGRAAEVQLKRTHERPIAAVGQWGDDQAALHTHVLIPVGELGRDHAHADAVFGGVVAQLG